MMFLLATLTPLSVFLMNSQITTQNPANYFQEILNIFTGGRWQIDGFSTHRRQSWSDLGEKPGLSVMQSSFVFLQIFFFINYSDHLLKSFCGQYSVLNRLLNEVVDELVLTPMLKKPYMKCGTTNCDIFQCELASKNVKFKISEQVVNNTSFTSFTHYVS